MKTHLIVSTATAIVLMATAMASAQNDGSTAPQNRGNTGWTGGSREPDPAALNAPASNADAPDQPWTATGLDLQGPARRYPPNQTRE